MTPEVQRVGSGWWWGAGGGSKVSNADEWSQGRGTQPGQDVDTERFLVSTAAGRPGPTGGEAGQEGRGQGQVLTRT